METCVSLNQLKDKWLSLVNSMNSKGIPIPLVRDPKMGVGSVSLTLLFLSFNIWVLSVIGKAAGALGGVNPDQCLNMFLSVAALYFGRKFQRDGSKSSLMENDSERSKET